MDELSILAKSKGRFQDLRGKSFGRWNVVEYSPKDKKWRCLCSCGEQRLVLPATLVNGGSSSCGCLQREATAKRMRTHGAHDANSRPTKEYAAWKSARNRCSNPSNKSYPRYGGRGIAVCRRWESFENFLCDMGKCPDGFSLDRIDNAGDYEPANCRWACSSTQANNRRSSRFLFHLGQSLTVAQWSKKTGIPLARIIQRIAKGWTTFQALDTPVIKRPRKCLSSRFIPKSVRKSVLSVRSCAHCGTSDDLSIDHIKPLSKGGTNEPANMQCLCLPCNVAKAAKWNDGELYPSDRF